MSKLKEFFDKEFQISIPVFGARKPQKKHDIKERPGYVNPFKHQEELREQERLRALRQKQEQLQQATLKAQKQAAAVARQKEEAAVRIQPVKPAEPIKQREPAKQEIQAAVASPPQPVPQPAQREHVIHQSTVPAKKITFTIPKPELKLPTKPRLAKHRKQIVITFLVLLGIAVVSSVAVYVKPPPSKDVAALSTANQSPIGNPKIPVINAVSKHVQLPTDEEPVLATISDKSKLPQNEFFKAARTGDKLLMYKHNKKVYLYRPALDQVIAVAPLEYEATTAPSGKPTQPRDQ